VLWPSSLGGLSSAEVTASLAIVAAAGNSLTTLLPELLRLDSSVSLPAGGLAEGRLASGSCTSAVRDFGWDATEERVAVGALAASVIAGAAGAGSTTGAPVSGGGDAGAVAISAEGAVGGLSTIKLSCLSRSAKTAIPVA